MNTHHYKPILISFIFALLLSACMKDKGNYTYTPINSITIQGVDSAYLLDYGTRLQIKPVLKFSKDDHEDTANYTYNWVADHLVGYTMAPTIISTSRNLDTVITLDYGLYAMYYRVTDKKTGVFTDSYFTLNVGAPSYEGWMMLCDMENGNSRLDMISHSGNTDTLYRDILKEVRSAYKTTGTPAFIATQFSQLGGPTNGSLGIFVATSKNAVLLGLDSLDYVPAYDLKNFMQAAEPVTDWTGADISLRMYGGLLYVNNNIYGIGYSSITNPVNTQDGGSALFKPSRWTAQNTSGQSIIFNEDTKTFLRYPGSGTTCLTLPAGDLFNFSTGMDLLYSAFAPFNSGEVFAVLKNSTTGKRYLARFTVPGKQNYFAEITGDGIADAENFAVSPDLGYLFYNVGGKVYEYDHATKRSILMHDYGNRKISLLKFQPFASTYASASNAAYYIGLSKKLLVGTYIQGQPENSGILDIYNVPDINAPLQLYKSYAGTGKISCIAYRER
ncbi:PKD-like family protein [Chitinophaga ginsengisegetis]|uniref:PKD-like family protein n=1 Tax=Chitinophaga ginsengisegetis TaxID=393003 RepID=A0A1T5P0J6_9BACT|nr:PKD-like family lipoprotein [Chitinophaga ginsengisegetis]SKD06274.1 PKD-like family protein [Chitinophaga ginsengisegetis]